MRRSLLPALLIGSALHGSPATAQMHKVARPEQVVRAVGVYEWTGDLKKPDASRLVPITVFIDGAVEDAGVYLPRPIPFALTPGNEYILQQAGIDRGSLDLAYARHLQTVESAYEDGWFGYGSYKAPPAPKKETALHASRNPAVLTSSKDDARPHLTTKGDSSKPGAADSTTKEPGSSQSEGTDTAGAKSSGGSAADDPDRPTMHRRSGSSTTPDDTSTASSPDNTPANDPDRPTLRRRSPDDAKKKPANDVASVTGTAHSLNDDPDRPKLQHGARSSANDTDIPKLTGVPKDLKQMVAVSDPVNRSPHDFARPWQDENEHTAVLTKMRALGRAQLQAYAADPLNKPLSPASPQTVTKSLPASRAAGHPARSSARGAPKPSASPEAPLLDEELRAYTLSYGGAPTYVYTAHTSGVGPDLRYVTVVAQADVSGDLRPAIKSATDEAHLDRTPRMRFVDVVDVEASNRASLLFELRAQSARQFALYRVIGSRADTLFTTGTTQ